MDTFLAVQPSRQRNYQDGYAQFENVNSGLCLSVDGLSTAAQTRIVQNPCYSWAANEQFAPVTIA
jgi:hypothetical protein